jgi:hypothetical protein
MSEHGHGSNSRVDDAFPRANRQILVWNGLVSTPLRIDGAEEPSTADRQARSSAVEERSTTGDGQPRSMRSARS